MKQNKFPQTQHIQVFNFNMATTMQATSPVPLPLVNDAVLEHFPFNVYAGTGTGILKGCKLDKLNSYIISHTEPVTKDAEITCMCWWDHNESFVLTGRRDGSVFNHSLESGTAVEVSTERSPQSSLKVIRSHGSFLATAFGNGVVKCYHFNQPEDADSVLIKDETQSVININSGNNLYSMDQSYTFPNLCATGGKDNPLKIWDISVISLDRPIFTAKNVKNDWLNLAVPVWETKTEFLPNSNKIVTGTGHGQIRLYDPSTPQRRPVIEIQAEFDKKKYPVSGLAIRPNSEFQLVFGTTTGNLAIADLRKKSVLKHFKGSAGGVTDVKFHPKYPIFASCGLGGHLKCYDADGAQKFTHSLYLRSPLNCLLFSSQCSFFDHEQTLSSKNGKHSAPHPIENEQNKDKNSSSDEDDSEEMWKSMEVVQTKKRKTASATSQTKSRKKKKRKKDDNMRATKTDAAEHSSDSG